MAVCESDVADCRYFGIFKRGSRPSAEESSWMYQIDLLPATLRRHSGSAFARAPAVAVKEACTMRKPVGTRTIRLAGNFLLSTGAIAMLPPRIMAQKADVQASSNSTSSTQSAGYANTGSVDFPTGSQSQGQSQSQSQGQSQSQSAATSSAGSNQDDWVHRWMRTVDKARASQPHFVSPFVTTHVILVQQFRYDMSWQQDPAGG